MSTNILHKAATRGHADHGWLDSWHTFSFAGYYEPKRVQFGMLRVLNDDTVAGGRGFGSHPHENMEIISIPLEGSLVHEDNLGHKMVVSQGEIQVMSTGTGVFHSEYNNNPDQPAKFLQIWVFPNKLNVTPRYDQVKLSDSKEHNTLQQIIHPAPVPGLEHEYREHKHPVEKQGTWIYQDAWFHMGTFDAGREFEYDVKKQGNGVYLFVIEGAFLYDGQRLEARDGLGVTATEVLKLKAAEPGSKILIMDVPMKQNIQ
jgi:redox-sensitive bicupin YhaK (pirin superfamily)